MGRRRAAVVGRIAFPKMLSFLGFSDFNAFVPGIRDIIEGGYELPDGETALSFEEKRARGRLAIQALADYRTAVEAGDDEAAALYKEELRRNYAYFGYGYLETPEDLIPPVGLTFYSFRIMVILGMWFILLFLVAGFFVWKRDIARQRWLLWDGAAHHSAGLSGGRIRLGSGRGRAAAVGHSGYPARTGRPYRAYRPSRYGLLSSSSSSSLRHSSWPRCASCCAR